jgi:hypothetical protein
VDGTPSHDHLGDIFTSLDAEHFQRCFMAWVSALTGVPAGGIAIDGKTSRRSKGANAPIHMVSAFVARQRLVLGQVKVAENPTKSLPSPTPTPSYEAGLSITGDTILQRCILCPCFKTPATLCSTILIIRAHRSMAIVCL